MSKMLTYYISYLFPSLLLAAWRPCGDHWQQARAERFLQHWRGHQTGGLLQEWEIWPYVLRPCPTNKMAKSIETCSLSHSSLNPVCGLYRECSAAFLVQCRWSELLKSAVVASDEPELLSFLRFWRIWGCSWRIPPSYQVLCHLWRQGIECCRDFLEGIVTILIFPLWKILGKT